MEQLGPQVAIVTSPGVSHLIPLVEFSKRLVHHHNLLVTIIIPTAGSSTTAEAKILESVPKSISHVFLPPPSFEDLSEDSPTESTVFLAVSRSIPSIRDTLKLLTAKAAVVALITDPFGSDVFDVAKEFNIPPYLFFFSSAMTYSLGCMLPKLDEMYSCEFRDLPEPLKLPGCVPVHGRDLMEPIQDRSNGVYKLILYHSMRNSTLAEGVLINSFAELEEGAFKALRVEEPGKTLVYPVGPVTKTGPIDGVEWSGCLEWLDRQPRGSVLFVSFGSQGILSSDQLNELALGLEMSGQRFLWVVRTPSDKASYLSGRSQNDPFDFLPKGFLDRTKDQGLVVPSWAPQIEVLARGSTGGFLTHCGWNSTLESIVHGVPLIAWPLFAEQKMNAILLKEGLNVALSPKVNENGLVECAEIEKVVKVLMEGEEGKKLCNRIKELKNAAKKVLSEDGSSRKSLSELVIKWKNQKSV